MTDLVHKLLDFLTDIGIDAREGIVPASSFLPGIVIAKGALIFDRCSLRWPGDLLHEAGHIAVTPAAMRGALDGAIGHPAGGPQGEDEVEAIAWSFAAITHLGVEPSVLFHADGYKGQSAALLLTYSVGVYPGVFGLAHAGMTMVGTDAKAAGLPPYPHMIRWLRA